MSHVIFTILQVALSFINIETAVKVIDMIKIYKQHGAHPSSDVISGLLDLFLVEPGFDPDLYKHVLEEENKKGIRDDEVSYSAKPADFPYDDNCKPSYSMPMPIRSNIPVENASSFSQKSTVFEDKRESTKTEISPSIFNGSMAASLRDDWDDEDDEIINNTKVSSDEFQDYIKFPVSIPVTQNDKSSYKTEYNSTKSNQEEVLQKNKPISDERFNMKMNSSTYRHLDLKPRSVPSSSSTPLPPGNSNKLPPKPPV